MTIWNVSPILSTDNKVRYIVYPYNLKEIVIKYLKKDKVIQLFEFLKNSRFTEKSARKYADMRSKQHDIQW